MLTNPEIDALNTLFEITNTDPQGFMCIYGSSLYKSKPDSASDIDIFWATTESANAPEYLASLTKQTISLHEQFGRKIDEEVPYENKLVYDHYTIDKATSLAWCHREHSERIVIPKIEKTSEFLSGEAIKMRLAVNALTTPHLCITRGEESYTIHKTAAEFAVTCLGIEVLGQKNISVENIFECLTVDHFNNTGEYYLGYKTEHTLVSDYLMDVVSQGVSRLVGEGSIARKSSTLVIPDGFNAKSLASEFTERTRRAL